MNIAAWLIDFVTVAEAIAMDNRGDPVFDTARKVAARVQFTTNVVRVAGGDEVDSDTTVYTIEPIKKSERIWLPCADPGLTKEAREVLEVTHSRTKTGGTSLYRIRL